MIEKVPTVKDVYDKKFNDLSFQRGVENCVEVIGECELEEIEKLL